MTKSSWDLYWIAVDLNATAPASADCRRRSGRARAPVGARTCGSDGGRETPTHARFYASMGYTIAGELKDFYAPGDSKIVLVKAL